MLLSYAAEAAGFDVFGPRVYLRSSGQPVVEVDSFTSVAPGSFTLHIHNGGLEDDEYELVSSSVIYLNGVQILSPNELNQNADYIQKTVTLQAVNEISVEVRGKPGGALILNIEGNDSTPPVITADVTPAANASGWHSSDPTISFSCSDIGSAIASCSSPVTLSTEGEGQVVTGTAVDLAGNISTVSVMINLDKTTPLLSLIGPQNGITVTESIVNVSGEASDALGAPQVTVNGEAAVLDGAGNFVHPVSLSEGQNTITVIASDAAGNAKSSSLQVELLLNQAPLADAQVLSTPEDSLLNIELTGSDADGDVLAFQLVSQPSHGVLSGSAPNLVYTPNPDFNGNDSFDFIVNDGTVDSAIATIEIDVLAQNDIPVAAPGSAVTAEDTPVAITLGANDIDGDTLSYVISAQPANGTLSGAGSSWTYTPDADFNGSDQFSFVASDGLLDSLPANVSISVTPVNDAPEAIAQMLSVDEDTPLALVLGGTDIDGDSLTFEVTLDPSGGQLSGTPPNLTYTPGADFNGGDSFEFVAIDGSLASAAVRVNITVNPVNDAPVTAGSAVLTDEDTPVQITFDASDVDGDSLSFDIASPLQLGSLSGTGGSRIYTPNPDANGTESIVFSVNDGLLDSNPSTVTVEIAAVNDAPTAAAQTLTTDEDNPLAVTLSGIDIDGDALSFTVTLEPANGTLTGLAPNLSYTPDANFNGSDSFEFTASDGSLVSAPARIDISVAAVNDKPVANDESLSTSEDTSRVITLNASDTDGDALSFIVAQPANGVLVGAGDTWTYTPNVNFNGLDQFTFFVNDGSVDSDSATIWIQVFAVNDAPAATPQSLDTDEDTPLAIVLGGSDIDGDTLTFTLTQGPASGQLTGTPPNLTYTPNANFNGADSILFNVSDGELASAPVQVDIAVNPVNDAPSANAQSLATAEDVALGITLGGQDVDGDTLSFAISTPPANGSVSGTPPDIIYQPAPDYFGSDQIGFTVSDGALLSGEALIEIAVTAVNDAPVITSTPVTSGQAGQDYAYQVGAVDVEGDNLTYSLSGPAGMSINATGLVSWSPTRDDVGTHPVSVTVSDGNGSSGSQVFDVVIDPAPNTAPVIISTPITMAFVDQQYVYAIRASDVDGDSLTFDGIALPAGMILDPVSGELTWTPGQGDTGAHLVSVEVDDGNGGSATQDFTLEVAAVDLSNAAYVGTEFWVPRFQVPETSQLILTSEFNTNVDIEILALEGQGITSLALQAGKSTTITIPRPIDGAYDWRTPNGIRNWALNVKSDDPISVQAFYPVPAGADALLALPVRSYGTEYLITTYGESPNVALHRRAVIIANEDDTQITITAAGLLRIDDVDVQPGEQYQLTLNRGEDFHLTPLPYSHDISGTSIVADKPVAVFSGHDSAFVLGVYANRLAAQLPAVSLWKNSYLTAPLRSRYGDAFRVIAAYDNTEVTVNGVFDSVLNRGEHSTFVLTEASEISANQPIMVAQHAVGRSYDTDRRQLDPFWDLKQEAIDQGAFWGVDQFVEIDAAPAPNYVFVLMPRDNIGDLVIDGVPLDASAFGTRKLDWDNQLPDPGQFYGAQIALTPGQHRFTAPVPFGLFKNTEALYRYADPAMTIVPAVDSYLSNYFFRSFSGTIARHFINITIPTSAIDTVVLDGRPVDPDHFLPLGATSYSYARLGVNMGDHAISADEPFGLLVYGFGPSDAYMYLGGWAFNQTRVSDSISITPTVATPAAVNSTMCLDIEVRDGANAVVPFAQIELTITGAHPDQQVFNANSYGVRQYCYDGIFAGFDQINAQSGAAQQALQIEWINGAGNNAPVIISAPVISALDGASYRYGVSAHDADADSLTFALLDGPTGMMIDAETGLISWIAVSGTYPVSVQVTDSAGASDRQDYQLSINRPPVLDLLPAEMMVSDYRYSSRIAATDPDGDQLYYSLELGNADFAVDGARGDIASFSALPMGNYPISIRISDRKGGVIDYSYTLVVSGVNSAPTLSPVETSYTVSAGDVVQIDLNPFDIDGDEILIGTVDSNVYSFVVDQATGQATWHSNLADVGNRQVTLVATDEWGEQSTPVTFDLNTTDNLPPVVTSTPPPYAYRDTLYEYQIVVDDPENRPVNFEVIYYPGFLVDLTNTGFISFIPPGYTVGSTRNMTVRITDSADHVVNYTFTFEIREQNLFDPQLDGGVPNQAIVGYPLSYQLEASDGDGVPVTFSLTSGPSGMTVTSDGLIEWTPEASQVGFQPVVVRLSDGERQIDVDWQIETLLNPLPLEANILVEPQFIAIGESSTLTVQVLGGIDPSIDSVLLGGLPVTLTNGQATISPSTVGRHDIVVNVFDDGEITSFTSFVSITDPSDVDPPSVTIESPAEGDTLTTLADVIGTVQDANLVDVYLYAQRVGSNDRIDLYRGTNAFVSQPIAPFDPTLLRNGQYRIVLQAIDVNGQAAAVQVTVLVEGGMKVGNFSITIEDLNIPVAGIPIQVTRTYDSRRRHEALDFGYGWSIDYQNVSVDESTEPTTDWDFYQELRFFTINGVPTQFPATCMRSASNKTVTVTLPNDDVEEFKVRLRGITGSQIADNDPDCDLTASTRFNLFFDPEEGTTSTLEAYDNRDLFISADGDLVDDIVDVIPSSVRKYRLTTKEGFVYNLDQQFGVESVVDPNGNTLTYADTGITHSSGKAILFDRDVDGRITSIVDPKGARIVYDYSTQSDLLAVTDRAGNTSAYEYDGAHYLTDLYDALGRRLLKNFYDDSGRLVAQEDADGNRTEFLHDVGARSSVVTDRLGRVTQYAYDERGNVTSEVDALGNLTTYAFDANDNQLSKTDALGNTSRATYDDQDNQLTQTDELGRVTSFTYNEFGKEVDITDPTGNTYRNGYDSVGNLVSINGPDGDPLGQNLLNSQGLVAQLTDALGNTTAYTYDGDGNKLTETDALGNVTRHTYDDNGNLLSETVRRSVGGVPTDETTTYVYDDLDRLVSTTDPLGNVSRHAYDAVGNKVQDTDALGRVTTYTYDAYRRLTRTVYPDGSAETMTYDAEGNLLSETDANGNVTSYQYDAMNRVTRTTFADGGSTQSAYDALGRVLTETDERGNVTTYAYDAAGQRVSMTDALGNVTAYGYDANGNLASMTDARGNTWQYAYDVYDNRTVTTWPDLSTSSEVTDRLGRVTGKTDQKGNTMSFAYDALGRLLRVTDALGNVTSYGYDEVGNKLTQTDALGRTTSWTYDALGRELTRRLPLGQQESQQYDGVGNRTQSTDFNGQVTGFGYDDRDRLVSATYNDATVESFTYDAYGNRIGANDRAGRNQSWSYDSRHRLTRVVDAAGNRIDYQYDLAGNKTQQTTTPVDTGFGIVSGYTYDALNRLQNVTDANGLITIYSYDANGNRASMAYPNGNVSSYTYDVNNRLTRLTTEDSASSVLADYQYTLDPSGHRLRIDEPGRGTVYTYDASYKLLTEDIADPINGNYSAVYEYDAVGNRTLGTIDGVATAYTYDANDRLLQQGSDLFTYDANGNTLSKTEGGFESTYAYDAKNHLSGAQLNDAGAVSSTTYDYNVDGIRTGKTEGADSVDYLIDPNREHAQVVRETDDGGISLDYLFGDDLIQQSQAATSERYYIYDGLGSTRVLSNEAGVISDTYDYEAFGLVLNQSGTTKNHYRFTGEQYDFTLNQYYLRARYYDHRIARFTQIDDWWGNDLYPITKNQYLYVSSDPVNFVDPSGYTPFGLSDITTALQSRGIQSSASTGIYKASFEKVGGKIICLAIKEVVEAAAVELITGGVYVLLDGDKPYVGRSKNFDRRFNEHKRDVNRRISKTLARFHLEFDIKEQRLVEQLFIDLFESTDPNKGTNKINSIAKNPTAVRNKGLRDIFDKLKICGN